MRKAENFLRKMSNVEKYILGLVFSGLVLIITYQIIVRWMGLRSLRWVEELCQHLWVCTTMIAVSIGTTDDSMMKVSALEAALPKKAGKILVAVINVLCGALSVYFAMQAYKTGTVMYKIHSVTTTLRMPICIFYYVIAICFIGVALRGLVRAVVLVQDAVEDKPDAVPEETKKEEKE